MRVLTTAARIGSGQDVLAAELARRWGWEVFEMGNVIRTVAQEKGLPLTRRSLQSLRREMNSLYGRYFLPEYVAQEVSAGGLSTVITGLRTKEDWAVLKSHFASPLLFVLADEEIRCERLLRRGKETDPVSRVEFMAQSRSEEELFDLDWLEARSEMTVCCNAPLQEFLSDFGEVEEVVKKHCKASSNEDEGFEVEYKRRLGDARVAYEGNVFRVIKERIEYRTKRGEGTFEAEIVERTPGVRAIIVKESKILMIREFRAEHHGWDWRLPGGRVFDDSKQYFELAGSNLAVLRQAFAAVKKEIAEEVGMQIENQRFLYRSRAGASVSWDLLYFVVEETLGESAARPEAGEIIYPQWMSKEEVEELCIGGGVKEDRTCGLLLRYLHGGFKFISDM